LGQRSVGVVIVVSLPPAQQVVDSLESGEIFARNVQFVHVVEKDYAYQHRVYFASVWGLLRNASCHEYNRHYHKRASAPIFQSRQVKCEGASIVGDWETLLADDLEEGSDSTTMEV